VSGIFVSEMFPMFCLNAEKLIDIILSGIVINQPGEYIVTPREAIENNKKYVAKSILLLFLKFLFCTIKKVIMDTTHKIIIILIIIHEKSHRDGLIN